MFQKCCRSSYRPRKFLPPILLLENKPTQNQVKLTSFSFIQVTSNMGADGSGSVTTYTGSVNDAGWRVTYKANHVYGASDPSCAQVFFYMVS